MPFDSLSAISRTPALALSNVTNKCISALGAVPAPRASEGFSLPSWISTFTDKIVPQAESRIYVVDDILVPTHGRVGTALDTVFPNYQVQIFQIEKTDQLLLVAISNELEIDPINKYPRSLPFLIYIPPSPQDTPSNHRKLFPALYGGVPDNKVPTFYKDLSGFPFSWDFLFFQFVMNIYATGLPAQLKKADKPFVLVIPMVKSFQAGMGKLNTAATLEQCLLGIELAVFDARVHVTGGVGVLPEVEWMSFAAFSIGNEILNRFVRSNGTSRFASQKVREYILFDPPPNNPANRSTIVQTLLPLVATLERHILLYCEDLWYFEPLLRLIAQKRISFNLTVEKIFKNSSLPSVFLAFLPRSFFGTDVTALITDDPHNAFAALFMKDAAQRTNLKFSAIGSQKFPDYPTP